MKRLLALLLWLPAPVLAHGGAHAGERGPPGWTVEPGVTVPLLLALLLFGIGAWRLRGRSGHGRPELDRRIFLFAAGWAVLAGAVVSPLHEAGERSFTMHMIEHELIMLVAALLLVLARPLPVMLWALPQRARSGLGGLAQQGWFSAVWRFVSGAVVATTLQAIALWAWHMPALFNRALGHPGWHVAQHLSFLVTALLFWWAMAHGRARHSYGVSAACLFVTSLVGGMLGALMSFSSSPWYESYIAMGMTPIGLTPAEDQQLAGLIMWIPGGLVHMGAALYFLYKWLKASEALHAAPAQ